MNLTRKLALVLAMSVLSLPMTAQNYAAPIKAEIEKFLPGTTGIGPIVVKSVNINDKAKTVTVKCSENTAYLPLEQQDWTTLVNGTLAHLPSKCAKYKVRFLTDGKRPADLEKLILRKTPTVKHNRVNFVTPLQGPKADKGLSGRNIALWQSHGWYFEPKLNRWEWQRARVMQTVEDLYTQSYVMPFLMPMLVNAGAYVMSPRERDTNLHEIIIDNDPSEYMVAGYREKDGINAWQTAPGEGFAHKNATLKNSENPFKQGTARMAQGTANAEKASVATWNAEIPEEGTYAVYVSYPKMDNAATDAVYTINSKQGARQYRINQNMGAGTWIYLGHFPFDEGTQQTPIVVLSNITQDQNAYVGADAVKIGGGMGNVARIVKEPLDSIDYKYTVSNYPRFVEGARYWLQWAGAPDSVYTTTNNVNDYTDDYRSRGHWVNWLAGGSDRLPQRRGLNIPIDLSLAFHTDAGTFNSDSIVGTLGIYSTQGPDLGDGMSREISRDLTDMIMTNITEDIRATYEPKWTRRGMWNSDYSEAYIPRVPSMLLELLSHQNFADMKYGLDPAFRFVVSRAIYKGMLQFLAHRDGVEYVVQPLPIHNFAITASADKPNYVLTWSATEDKLEPTARPTYYIIEQRIDDGAFMPIATVKDTTYTLRAADDKIHSLRIIAGNDGGVSFPSEVLALCNMPDAPVVNIVNGFTRVSAPDWFEAGDIAGFYDGRDHGVPYVTDISYIGSQFEFRRDIPWMDDDAAGFGASRADYEEKVIAGNTFDYVYTHGEAIRSCGYGFVSSSVEAFTNAQTTANEPRILDLILGKQKEIKQGRGVYGTKFKTFPSALQDRLTSYTNAGGNVFVSGAFIATDLWDNPHSSATVAEADQKFAREVLGYNWRVGQASVTGEAYQVDCRYKAFTLGDYVFSNKPNEDCYVVESPDSFYEADTKNGATFMRYTENNLIAGTVFNNPKGYRTVAIGFPFESILHGDMRKHLMGQVLDFLSTTPAPLQAATTTPKAQNSKKKNKK